MSNGDNLLYTALFVLDVDFLIKTFRPIHSIVYGHHSTISFKPDELNDIEPGKKYKIKILGRVYDEKGDVLLVENKRSKNKFPHITLSCAEGVDPFYSNELLEKSFTANKIKLLDEQIEIEVIEGYSDGKIIFLTNDAVLAVS